MSDVECCFLCATLFTRTPLKVNSPFWVLSWLRGSQLVLAISFCHLEYLDFNLSLLTGFVFLCKQQLILGIDYIDMGRYIRANSWNMHFYSFKSQSWQFPVLVFFPAPVTVQHFFCSGTCLIWISFPNKVFFLSFFCYLTPFFFSLFLQLHELLILWVQLAVDCNGNDWSGADPLKVVWVVFFLTVVS